MRHIRNIFSLTGMLLALFISCSKENLDPPLVDDTSSVPILTDIADYEILANRCVDIMRSEVDLGYTTYVKDLFQATEFAADNVLIVRSTTDPSWLSFTHNHYPHQANTSAVWELAYKSISTANTIINNTTIDENSSDLLKQYTGEAYFYRGRMFFDLARVFSFPPSHGLDNRGIILRTGINDETQKARASVRETYARIISDLKKASELMTERSSDGIKYGNKYAALGYLSRAYLFTEDYDLVIYVANQLLEGNSPFTLDSRDTYIANLQTSYNSKEAMFILYHKETAYRSYQSLSSMYNGDGGWGEVYPSEPYLDLISQHPTDIRTELIDSVLDNDGNPEKYPGTNYNKVYITKFSYQDSINTLHSPIFMRLSEVLLNRAEAYAHLGQDQKALNDINTIRTRAGLTGDELITLVNLSNTHAYKTVLDAVIAERRLELAFEGQRRDDLLRNKIDLNRDYPSAQHQDGMDVLPYYDPRQIYYIPSSEINYNPLCIQNN